MTKKTKVNVRVKIVLRDGNDDAVATRADGEEGRLASQHCQASHYLTRVYEEQYTLHTQQYMLHTHNNTCYTHTTIHVTHTTIHATHTQQYT
jgi:hypothetical protein